MDDGVMLLAMEQKANIIICDKSALHYYLHTYSGGDFKRPTASINPMLHCASTSSELRQFNSKHPLFGDGPVDVLVAERSSRRVNAEVHCAYCGSDVPPGSFWKLRDGLYITSPEFTFLRLASLLNANQLAEVGMNLCAGYYIDVKTSEIRDRGDFLISPERLASFVEKAEGMRGSAKARKTLDRIIANSGSPAESKMKLIYCNPMRDGGFNLPFDLMNYDVQLKRFAKVCSANFYSIDLIASLYGVGAEYDGNPYHKDASADKRRRNVLEALGYTIFPIDWTVLGDAEEMERSAYQIARRMHVRIQKPKCWEEKYIALRKDLGLPV